MENYIIFPEKEYPSTKKSQKNCFKSQNNQPKAFLVYIYNDITSMIPGATIFILQVESEIW